MQGAVGLEEQEVAQLRGSERVVVVRDVEGDDPVAVELREAAEPGLRSGFQFVWGGGRIRAQTHKKYALIHPPVT